MASATERSALISPAARRPRESLCFLTMDEAPLGHLQQIEAACEAGIRWIQLRMKQAGADEFLEVAVAAKKICDTAGCMLLINDRVDIAAAIKAHGVHLGQSDMPPGEARQLLGDGFIIGGTANTAADIREHYRQGADYIGLGPCRYTTTKKKLSPLLGLEGYSRIMDQLRQESIDIPVMAIGGIGKEDLGSLLQTGIQGIAFSGLLVHAADRQAAVSGLKEEIRKVRSSGVL